jgi:diaminopimelate decarboxylase
VPAEKRLSTGAKGRADVVGPVCESSDRFATDPKFPKAAGPGSLLAILSAGAYGFSMASTYNSRPRPPEVLVEGGAFRVVRRRETEAELMSGEI